MSSKSLDIAGWKLAPVPLQQEKSWQFATRDSNLSLSFGVVKSCFALFMAIQNKYWRKYQRFPRIEIQGTKRKFFEPSSSKLYKESFWYGPFFLFTITGVFFKLIWRDHAFYFTTELLPISCITKIPFKEHIYITSYVTTRVEKEGELCCCCKNIALWIDSKKRERKLIFRRGRNSPFVSKHISDWTVEIICFCWKWEEMKEKIF